MRSAWVLTSAVGAVLVLSICSQPTIAADTKKFLRPWFARHHRDERATSSG